MTSSDGRAIHNLRVELAAAHRLAVRDGLTEGSWNHFSVAIPGTDALLITPPGVHWSQVTASNLVMAMSGSASGTGTFRMHKPIHDARPDEARVVLHAHPESVVALSMVRVQLNSAEQTALHFHDRIAYTDGFDGAYEPTWHGARLAAELGQHDVLILNHHGCIVVGRSVAEAYTDLYLLERAARTQILAMSTGHPVVDVTPVEVATVTARQTAARGSRDFRTHHFLAMLGVLDATEPDYKS